MRRTVLLAPKALVHSVLLPLFESLVTKEVPSSMSPGSEGIGRSSLKVMLSWKLPAITTSSTGFSWLQHTHVAQCTAVSVHSALSVQ